MIKELYRKTIRYLVNNSYLGLRALNASDYGVKYDTVSERIYQWVGGRRIYIQHPKHGVPNYAGRDTIEWLCEDVYYGNYLPCDGEVVVDIGTGYGHEIAWLKSKSDVKVICIEPNPEVFVYLQMNLLEISGVILKNLFVGEKKYINFPLTTNYAGATSKGDKVGIRVNGATLDELLREYSEIALLKLNIEGGELSLLETSDLTKINRIIVSCHDFRANRGDGEYFRTYDKVKKILKDKGFYLSQVETEFFPTQHWRDSVQFWIYAYK